MPSSDRPDPDPLSGLMARLGAIGAGHATRLDVRDRVWLSNHVAVYVVALGSGYAIASLLGPAAGAAWLPAAAAVTGLATLALNAAGLHQLSRFVLAVVPVLACWAYQALLVPPGDPPIVPLYLGTCAFALYLFVLFSLRERASVAAALTVGAFAVTTQEWLNAALPAAGDGDVFRSGWPELVTYAAALSIAATSLALFARWQLAAERARDDALARLESRVEDAQTSRDAAEQSRDRLAERLRQSEKMEAVGRLAGGVAHDLNNMLVPILSAAQILEEDYADDPAVRELAEEISEGGLRARDLVERLLTFARRQPLSIVRLDVDALLTSLKPLLRRTTREDIELVWALAGDLPPIEGDRVQLTQLVLNLVVNAQDALPDGGRVRIETRLRDHDHAYVEQVPGLEPGRYVVVAVEDDGTGIPSDALPKLFEPFFSTKGDEGTGLGLSTVFGVARQHGGHVTVYSEEGHGTVFHVHLPAAEGAITPTPALDAPARGGDERVLVVEDDARVRATARRVLRRLGYAVSAVDGGEAALAWIEEHGPPDLLLTDVIMPGMTGPELVHAARARHPSQRALLMSGYTGDVLARRAETERHALLAKPFSMQELARAVRGALDDAPPGG